MPPWPIFLALAGILLTFVGVFAALILGINWQFLEKPLVGNLVAIVVSVANVLLVFVTFASVVYLHLTNTRAEKAFVGEIHPLIDVTPVGISKVPVTSGGTQVTTIFSAANYSGFPAYNIGIDLKYGEDATWILEWRKAHTERQQKGDIKGVELRKIYPLPPISLLPKLESGETAEYPGITGSFSLEDICKKGQAGHPVYVRVTWRNEKHHFYDEIYKYKLICTMDTDQGPNEGVAFTFVPEGPVSEKAKHS